MKVQFKHQLTSSFLQWFDYTLISQGAAFRNISSPFYQMNDNRYFGYTSFATPFGQLVSDNSIGGATILSGVYVNNNFLARGQSGLILDFQRGRVLLPTTFTGSAVSGDFAMKEFDIVYTTKTDDMLVSSSRFSTKPRYAIPFTGLSDDEILTPVVFVSKQTSSDVAYEFGGLRNSISNFRCLAITDNQWQLDGLESIFTAQKDKNFPFLTDTPFNEFGDLKTGGYDYNSILLNANPSELVYIKSCVFTRFENSFNQRINPQFNFAVIEVTIEKTRF